MKYKYKLILKINQFIIFTLQLVLSSCKYLQLLFNIIQYKSWLIAEHIKKQSLFILIKAL